ncbi:hypothetical protein T10_4303 [Trichinella papuae]|uniref:Uncharacterized protein n=1 Tax=Trichinella papuae TaxID=268474 RepID=A0A0V1MIH3_9BILA|nr:hypothetical protein T10_6243 [Trichinella papuae]KRZ71545.1 hypothetical protein T10_4303 [Trichinella papuae]
MLVNKLSLFLAVHYTLRYTGKRMKNWGCSKVYALKILNIIKYEMVQRWTFNSGGRRTLHGERFANAFGNERCFPHCKALPKPTNFRC